MHNETVIFLHIPRTAGTTLHRIIDRQYRQEECHWIDRHNVGIEEFKNLPPARRAEIRMLRGHMPFGLHKYIPGPSTYFTLLRDPVERVVSYYYFVRRDPQHYLHDYALVQGMTLKRYIESQVSLATDNCQTRIISGVWDTLPHDECTEATLASAKRNLAEHFTVVGLTERFDETLMLLKQRFAWQNVFYQRQNVTWGRPGQESLPAETLAVVRERNQLDLRLYTYAEALFAAQIRNQGTRFAVATRRFQIANRWLKPLIRAYLEARKISVRTLLRETLRKR
jgi:hypothetical protein